jgi:O-antigen/teichoic acid export membrane protein
MEKNREDLNNIKRKTVLSTLSLFFQSGYSSVLGLAANLVLTILLTPATFGIYIATLSIISILNYFSDIGLAASLIQKKEVTHNDEKTAFTIQQILVITLVTLGFISTGAIAEFYKLPNEGRFLYWALLAGFFLSSLKTMPSVLLEKEIKFEKVVLVQIIENTVFYITVIVLAIMGYALNSFTVAVILRSLVGVILIYSFSPWKISIGIDRDSYKKLISFGLPFQASSLLALVKDDLLTLYLGRVVGFTGLGYIGWAKKWAESPIRIIMDSISRVLFPLFSKFQTDRGRLSRLIEKIVHYQSLLIIPSIVGMALVMSRIVAVIPKYSKWEPALPLFYLFCLSALMSSYSTPFINFLNGIGRVKISFYFMVFWTALTWILTPILIGYYGHIGFPITLVILSSTFVIVIMMTKKVIDFNFSASVYPFFFSTVLMALVVLASFNIPAPREVSLIIAIAAGIISYILSVRFIFKIDFSAEIMDILKHKKNG